MTETIVVAGIAPQTVEVLRDGFAGVEIRSVETPSELANLEVLPALLIVGDSKEETFLTAVRQQPLLANVRILF